MKSQATEGPQAPGQASIKTRRFSVSLVWIVPIVAVLVGISLVVHSLKMPQLAMPVRVLLMGTAQTPSLDAVLELMARETVLQRLQNTGKNVL